MEAQPEPSFQFQAWHIFAAVALVAVLACLPVLSNEIGGRGRTILANPLHTLTGVPSQPGLIGNLWSESYWGPSDDAAELRRTYRPLTTSMYGLLSVVAGIQGMAISSGRGDGHGERGCG